MEVPLSSGPVRVLYLSYDGLTDPLGQSQILPYLENISHAGFKYVVVSFEKKSLYVQLKSEIANRCQQSNIEWIPLLYHKNPPVLSTLWDLMKLYFKAIKLHKRYNFQIVHCRSYISSLVGLYLKKKNGIRFVFDMRGLWADERIERNIWNAKNLVFKAIYRYFKRKEKQFLYFSDAVVTLTDASRSYLIEEFAIPAQRITTIPCAATFKFSDLQVEKKDLTPKNLIYIGSFRTAYLADEMFLFFSIFRRKYARATFTILTGEKIDFFKLYLIKHEIPEDCIIVKKVNHDEVHKYLRQADLGICFIKPVFSSIASSPTKFAEMLAADLPVVCNNIGDLKQHCQQIPFTYCFDSLNEAEFEKFFDNFVFPTEEERKTISVEAAKIYDVNLAVKKYISLYNEIL